MQSKSEITLLAAAFIFLQTPSSANDLEKIINTAKTSGQKQLMKQAEAAARAKLGIGGSAKANAQSGKQAASSAPAAAGTPQAAARSTAATQAATLSTNSAGKTAGASEKVPAGSAPAANTSLIEKMKHRAAVESTKYGKKYGSKFLKQGENQVGKTLK
jgi:hypothetical protein